MEGRAWLAESAYLQGSPTAGIDKKFLFLLPETSHLGYLLSDPGSGMVHITKSQFSSIRLLVPPESEQHRIVAKIEELFSELDDSEANLETARVQLKTYRQSLLKHAFEGRLTGQWRRDHADELESADQLLERIREKRQARYQQQLENWKTEVAQWEADDEPGSRPPKPARAKELGRRCERSCPAELIPSTGWSLCFLGDLIGVPEIRYI
ncbi:MAG: restriction endonuclease subunit S [Halofilum sp. (in: g-proteobacteria)]|nr:restriction endonuclease subunit S [Halofilum sp. (in: g-proteobacteria)]